MWLVREKTARWDEYKEVRREFGRNNDLTAVSLNVLNQMNYKYRNFVRNNQCLYEGSVGEGLGSSPKLFYSYVRRKKGCLI